MIVVSQDGEISFPFERFALKVVSIKDLEMAPSEKDQQRLYEPYAIILIYGADDCDIIGTFEKREYARAALFYLAKRCEQRYAITSVPTSEEVHKLDKHKHLF